MISSINTPVRWYEDIFESERFSSDCDIERFELISDKTRLLPFQFRRPKSGIPLGGWFLRKQCVDPTLELLDSRDSLFTYDTGYWSTTRFNFVNGKLRARGGVLGSDVNKSGVFTPGKYYDVTVVVNEFVVEVGSTFAVTYDIAGSGTVAITSTGTIKLKILATGTDFAIYSIGGTANDRILIESISIKEYQNFDTGLGDISLDLSLLTIINLDTTYDLIQYCGDALPVQIPCGKYYIIIAWGDTGICYSELITIKDFIPSRSPFTMIEWRNSCDLADIIYQSVNGCLYTNRLYIDSELSKMEYPFKEEGEEDGNYKLNITFQKWEKTSNLMVAKCPEFIVDALTGIRLHDTVSITKSIRKNQQEVLPSFEVEKVEYENTSVFIDCATNVELKLLLKDNVVDSTCCTNVTLPPCFTCTHTVDSMDTLTEGYYFGTPSEVLDFGLYQFVDPDYIEVAIENTVVCVKDTDINWIHLGAEWKSVPRINNVVDTDLGGGDHSYKVSGYLYPNSYCRIHAIVYDGDNASTTTADLTEIYTTVEFAAGIDISSIVFGIGVPLNGTVSFYVENFALNCDYGISNTFETMYLLDLHPVIDEWNSENPQQLTSPNIFHFNNFIQGIDDDGFLDKFDLLHVLAGLDTEQQRLKPFITSSGIDFGWVSAPLVNDFSGITGDGSNAVDLSYRSSVDNVKMLAGDGSFGCYISTNISDLSYDMGFQSSTPLASFIRARRSGGDVRASINNTGGTITTTVSDSIGLYQIVASGSDCYIYKDGTQIATLNTAPPSLDYSYWWLGSAWTGTTPLPASLRQYQLVFIGSAAIDVNALFSRFMTLKGAISF